MSWAAPQSRREDLQPLVEQRGLNIDYAWACTNAGQPMPAIFLHWPGRTMEQMLEQRFRCVPHLLQNALRAAYLAVPRVRFLVDLCATINGLILSSSRREKEVNKVRKGHNKTLKEGEKAVGELKAMTEVRWGPRVLHLRKPADAAEAQDNHHEEALQRPKQPGQVQDGMGGSGG